ncbi:MAG: hypothetical protein U9Q97_04535, partial [Acidobacteriota bacterium]|nr:hypothetical protein [Acidobacteriota bacterium]
CVGLGAADKLGRFAAFPLTITIVSVFVYFVSMFLRILFRLLEFHEVNQIYSKLSIVGIMRKRKTQQVQKSITILMYALGIFYVVYSFFSLNVNIYISVVFSLLALFLFIGQIALGFRIKEGFFGNNKYEARQIIGFIISESRNIDFTDEGKLKEIISDEDLRELRQRVIERLSAGSV